MMVDVNTVKTWASSLVEQSITGAYAYGNAGTLPNVAILWPFAIWGSRRKLNHLPLFTIVDPYMLSITFLPWHRGELLGC